MYPGLVAHGPILISDGLRFIVTSFVYPSANFHRSIETMKKNAFILLFPLLVGVLSGCSSPGMVAQDAPGRPKIDRIEVVRTTGRQAAVLSVHQRTNFQNACRYGMTLTNNLTYKITNISFRFDAFINGGVFYQHVTRNFWQLDPTNSQYREVIFTGIECNQIDYIEIHDPGRCAMGNLTRFSSEPGDCIRHVDIAPTSLVRLVRK